MAAKKQNPQARQLKELRVTVRKLRAQLADEARQRKRHMSLVQESKKVRAKIVAEVEALRERGRSLAKQLKDALGDAARRSKTRDEAMKRLAELRKELSRRTEELRHKSGELTRLARESAERARAILYEAPETHPEATRVVVEPQRPGAEPPASEGPKEPQS